MTINHLPPRSILNYKDMIEKELTEFLERADKIVKRLSEALSSDEESDEVSSGLMLYATAKFAAGILLYVQEETCNIHIEDDFMQVVKEIMKVEGKDERIQSLKNTHDSLKNQIAKKEEIIAKSEKRIEQNDKEIAQCKKRIAENEKIIEEIMREKERLLGKIKDDDEILN